MLNPKEHDTLESDLVTRGSGRGLVEVLQSIEHLVCFVVSSIFLAQPHNVSSSPCTPYPLQPFDKTQLGLHSSFAPSDNADSHQDTPVAAK